jgi:hypothetical protein
MMDRSDPSAITSLPLDSFAVFDGMIALAPIGPAGCGSFEYTAPTFGWCCICRLLGATRSPRSWDGLMSCE